MPKHILRHIRVTRSRLGDGHYREDQVGKKGNREKSERLTKDYIWAGERALGALKEKKAGERESWGRGEPRRPRERIKRTLVRRPRGPTKGYLWCRPTSCENDRGEGADRDAKRRV